MTHETEDYLDDVAAYDGLPLDVKWNMHDFGGQIDDPEIVTSVTRDGEEISDEEIDLLAEEIADLFDAKFSAVADKVYEKDGNKIAKEAAEEAIQALRNSEIAVASADLDQNDIGSNPALSGIDPSTRGGPSTIV